MVLRLFNRDTLLMPSQLINEYTVDKIIGEGRYGICYQLSSGQKHYILKQLKRGMLKKAGSKAGFEEEILKNLQHDSIPRFIEKIEFEGFCGYVLEFKEGRTFEEIIYNEGYVFGRKEIIIIGLQLIEILKYLHLKEIVHRDIRVPNTLYDGKTVYLVDFGLARWINNKKYRADMDFAFLGDFLLHLYYSSFELQGCKKRPWYEELELTKNESEFLKRLMGIQERYINIIDVEQHFFQVFEVNS